eukprot:2956624-Prymnesium_polylepis.1
MRDGARPSGARQPVRRPGATAAGLPPFRPSSMVSRNSVSCWSDIPAAEAIRGRGSALWAALGCVPEGREQARGRRTDGITSLLRQEPGGGSDTFSGAGIYSEPEKKVDLGVLRGADHD